MVRQNKSSNRFGTSTSSTAMSPDEDVKTMWARPDVLANNEGGLSFKMDDYNELVTRVAACFFGEPQFYQVIDEKTGIIQAQNQHDDLIRLAQTVAIHDPQFVLQLAAYARNELYLRTVATVLWTEVAILHGIKKIPANLEAGELVKSYASSILKRADEPLEALAYYIAKNGSFIGDGGRYPQFARKNVVLANAMRRGIEDAVFTNFDHYQLAKYNRKNAAVKMKDMINLVHPRPQSHDQAIWNGGTAYWNDIFKRVLSDTLPPATTWEDTLMRWKEKGFKSKKEAWESIIPKMGYMALLRNLRNLIEADIHPTMFDIVVAKLRNPEEVKKSKQFPYRFYTAYKMLEQTDVSNMDFKRKAQTALEDAMDASLDNLPKWSGKTAIAADFSGSMGNRLSSNSIISLKEVAALFMVMASRMCSEQSADCYAFSDFTVPVNVHERAGVLDNVDRILRTTNAGPYGGTEAWTTISYFLDKGIKYDRCVLFSDLQCYNKHDKDRVARDNNGAGPQIAPLWNRYKRAINPNAYLYSIDLAGYGTSVLPISTHNLFLGGGFSDRILGFVPLFESSNNTQTMVEAIKAVNPGKYEKMHKVKTVRTIDNNLTDTVVDPAVETEETEG
jgi:60 kDa SS-A/Ro ribonucleoprotein